MSFEPDPAAQFGAALSLYEAAKALADARKFDLSDAYSGGDEVMRRVMHVGVAFEAWACKHVDFDELADVWPYLLEDKFGEAFLAVMSADFPEVVLDLPNDAQFEAIARNLNLPLC